MPEQDLKKLSDLRVVDLKLKLERRGLSHYLELLDRNQAEYQSSGKSSSKQQSNTLSKEVLKVVPEEVFRELCNDNSEACSKEVFMEVTEEVSEPNCQTVPFKLPTNRILKYVAKEKEPEKIKVMQKNTVSKSSIEDLTEEDDIDLVVIEIEDDEDELHLSFNDETLCDRETSTPVSVSKSTDDNIVDAGNGKNKTRDLDNRQKTWVEKVHDTSSNRKTATLTKQKTTDQTCSKVVWVSNVSHNTSASELQGALSAYGNVISAKVVVSARYPGSSCYGYVTMASNEDVDNVIAKLNNTELNGQIIKLERKMNDKITTPTRSKDASKIQGKKAVSERTLQQNRPIERSRSMEKSRSREGSYSNERFKRRRSRSPCRKSGILTFAQIKEERERQKLREQERALREASRRRHEEIARQKDIDRRQRQEAMRLEREKEKLQIEKEKIVRERKELMKLEQEHEKIEMEKTLSRLEEGGINQPPLPHRVNGRKRFATGNRHLEADWFDYSARKSHSVSTGKLYGSSKNNCGKFRPYDGGNCYNKNTRNYDGPSRSSSSNDDSKPYDCQDRTSPHRPKQNSGNAQQRNVHNMYKESKRNNDLHYNKTKSRLFGSFKPFQTSAIPNWPATFDKTDWRPTPTQNNRRVSGNPHQLHPYSNMPSNLNPQYAPQTKTTNY